MIRHGKRPMRITSGSITTIFGKFITKGKQGRLNMTHSHTLKREVSKNICKFRGCKEEVWRGVCNGYCKKHHYVKCMGKGANSSQRELVGSTCSNCSAKLKDSALAILDGNPKHQRLCPKCSKTIIVPPN